MDKWPEPRPIEEAPKGDPTKVVDRVPILAWMWKGWRIAYWTWDNTSRKPKPYWYCHEIGVSSSREHQPQWWIPLPPPIK
jgi:hypothetical protein